MELLKYLNGEFNNHLVVVSNRGAYTLEDTPAGEYAKPSISGLVSAIDPIIKSEGGSWVAWGGRFSETKKTKGVSLPLNGQQNKYAFHEVLLTKEEVELYYAGFANSCLWPILHSFVDKAEFHEKHWQTYQAVNQKYAQVVLETTDNLDLIWIQDFHLALLPKYIRAQRPSAKVSLFWHVPFPPVEVFSVMPWAKEIIKGLMDCDFIGFHTEDYVHNFLHTANALLGAEVNYQTGTINWSGHHAKVAAIPIGIDCQEYDQITSNPEVKKKADEIRAAVGDKYIVLSVDRLDYTKGIPERLLAIEWLLENYPEYRSKLIFMQIAAPSRKDVPAYQSLKRQVEEIAGRINGKFNEDYHVPVRYMYQSFSKEDLVAHYMAADMALVTPLKDGLNLVAKEYVAAKSNGEGVLLLSPFAGAAEQLKDALKTNPYSPELMAREIVAGLEMSVDEKKRRMNRLNKIVREQDIFWWWREIHQHWLTDAVPKKVALPIVKTWPFFEYKSGKTSKI